ncbi:MAG TPA: glycoside hydrolase domain-containing protein [Pseudonocardiaceae bacterium]|nr:glycoside hydrolase domain-containing protein [Pseudonocardiaceae bacterium]
MLSGAYVPAPADDDFVADRHRDLDPNRDEAEWTVGERATLGEQLLPLRGDRPGAGAAVDEQGFDGINHPPALTLIADGIEVAFLYGGTPASTSGKDFSAAQYGDYKSHGIKCAFVYENLATDWRGGASAGRAHAIALLADLAAKRTDGTDPVAVSIDQHVDTGDLPVVVQYVTAFARAIVAAGYRGPVGVYGFREVLDAVHAAGVVAWYWCAGARSTVPAYANVWQDNNQMILVGGSDDDVDWILVPLPGGITDMTPDDLFAAPVPQNPKPGTVGYMIRSYQPGFGGVNSAGGMASDIVNTTNGVRAITGSLSTVEADLLDGFKAAAQHVDVELSAAAVAELAAPISTQLAALPGAVRQAIGQALVATASNGA